MQSKAASVKEYLASLPADRRAAIAAVRDVVNANLDKDYEEGMQYGMIGWYVPLSVFPPGYHCDPKQGLPFAGLASQKQYMSLYMMGLYCGCVENLGPGGLTPHAKWFHEAWAKTGKKLDAGKCCIRFKRLEDLALDVIGESIRRMPAKKYIAHYVEVMEAQGRPVGGGKPAKGAGKKAVVKNAPPKKKTAKAPGGKKAAKKAGARR